MKLKLAILIACLLFFPTNLSRAEESTPGAKPWEVRQQARQEKKAEVKAKLTEKIKTRIKNIYSRIKTRLENRINRLTALADRIESQFPKWEEKGRDTVTAKAKLDEARSELETAKTNLVNADAKLEELLASEDPKALRDELHEAVKKVRQDLVSARQAIAQAVRSLKSKEGGSNEE